MRLAIGDNGKQQRLVKTFSRRGVRFVADDAGDPRVEMLDGPRRSSSSQTSLQLRSLPS